MSSGSGELQSASRHWVQKMEKALCLGSMAVAGLLLLLFLLDLFLSIPFQGLSTTVDIFGVLACALVLFLAWDALRDLR